MAQEIPDTPDEAADVIQPEIDSNTTSYGQDFFARYPNAISVLDIINRIPAGKRILDQSGNDNARGFSRNTDLILIDGKRLAGKSNGSEAALQRITIDKVLRVDIIQGSSPDIKVNSQESIINIILKEGAGGGSGIWRFDTEFKAGKEISFGGFLSYGGSIGDFEYFVSAQTDPGNRTFPQTEWSFDGNGVFTGQLNEVIHRRNRNTNFTGNLGYTFKDGSVMHFNGLYQDNRFSDTTSGTLFTPGGMGGLVFAGNSARFFDGPETKVEIGADYEKDISNSLKFKFIGLYSVTDENSQQNEDFLITGMTPVVDFIFFDQSKATELIGRLALTWQINPKHSIEFGSEQAINELDVDLTLFQNDGTGALVPVIIPSSDVLIKEVRNETFFIHSWQISSKANLDTSLFLENFTISQTGVGVDTSQKFFFFRPSFNFRYNITKDDQFQFSIKREIVQLNFRDFAASASDDDEVVAGNTQLVPEKRWRFETSIQHNLANDGGRIKLTGIYELYSDRIERVQIAPMIDGVGNVGKGTLFQVIFETSTRLTPIGLPDVIVETRVSYYPTKINDPFTGQERRFNGWDTHNARISFRHDVNSLGLSYGGEFHYYPVWQWQDINEERISIHRYWGEFFIEKKLFGTVKVKFNVWDIFNKDEGRLRNLFATGRSTGIISSSVLRERREGRNFQISFQGTF
ncbi:MAG: TonB-dependent receptor plug domain-containing protein [Alphaproteobacteria bacterium]